MKLERESVNKRLKMQKLKRGGRSEKEDQIKLEDIENRRGSDRETLQFVERELLRERET